MWFKVDDQLAFHPKVLRAGNAAMGLWVRAGSWSADKLTDGFVPNETVAALGARTTDAERLVKSGLWDAEPGGYRFHDWTVFQPSRQDVELIKESRKVGGTRGAHDRWHAKRNITNPDCEWCMGVAHG